MKINLEYGSLVIRGETPFENDWLETFVYQHPYISFRETGDPYENRLPEIYIDQTSSGVDSYSKSLELNKLFDTYCDYVRDLEEPFAQEEGHGDESIKLGTDYSDLIRHFENRIVELKQRQQEFYDIRKGIIAEYQEKTSGPNEQTTDGGESSRLYSVDGTDPLV